MGRKLRKRTYVASFYSNGKCIGAVDMPVDDREKALRIFIRENYKDESLKPDDIFISMGDGPIVEVDEEDYQLPVRELIEAAIRCAPTDKGKRRIGEIDLHFEGYAEPGYTDPDSGIIALGNWNSIWEYDKELRTCIDLDTTPTKLCDILEKHGVCCNYYDEFIRCDSCGKLFRCVEDSYQWTMYGHSIDGEYICGDCITEDPQEYLEDLRGNPGKADKIIGEDLYKYGYTEVPHTYEYGLCGGQSANPYKIADILRSKGITNYLFSIINVSQFDLSFSVWVGDDQYESLLTDSLQRCRVLGPDPAVIMKKGLQAIAKANTPNTRKGIVHHTIHSDGSIETKVLTPEDLIPK